MEHECYCGNRSLYLWGNGLLYSWVYSVLIYTVSTSWFMYTCLYLQAAHTLHGKHCRWLWTAFNLAACHCNWYPSIEFTFRAMITSLCVHKQVPAWLQCTVACCLLVCVPAATNLVLWYHDCSCCTWIACVGRPGTVHVVCYPTLRHQHIQDVCALVLL